MRIKDLSLAVIMLIALGFLSGCAGILNPYSSDFECPETQNGKCVSMTEAYDESLGDVGDTPEGGNGNSGVSGSALSHASREDYEKELFREMANLLREPETPMVVPPKVIRVLLLPYTGRQNDLYMARYIFFFVDEPRWMLSGDATEVIE